MNSRSALTALLAGALSLPFLAPAQEMDKELETLAQKLASSITENTKKKVTVLDFTDLQGSGSELGKYIAEQLTVNLVIEKKGFAVLDRANLKSILAEHKLTATGLVDPEAAKKLGQFAGVDALVLGTITPKGANLSLTAKIITTDTAEVVGAARAEFRTNETVQALYSRSATASIGGAGPTGETKPQAPKASKTFEDMRVDIDSVQIMNGLSGQIFLANLSLSNTNARRSIWVAYSADMVGTPRASLRDAGGYEFKSDWSGVSGVPPTALQYDGFFKAVEIKPGETITAGIKFGSRGAKDAAPGPCNVQIEFLLGYNYDGQFGKAKVKNFTAKIDAE